MTAAPRHYGRWSATEIAIMHREYPGGGYKAVAEILCHRSLDAIRMRASILGLRRKGGGADGQA